MEPRLKSLPDVRLHEVGELYVDPEDAAHFYNVVSNKVRVDNWHFSLFLFSFLYESRRK